jgi:CelD/BcsL family acetyltransferase involved in cellulose biosynthesis
LETVEPSLRTAGRAIVERVEWITTAERFAALKVEWDELAAVEAIPFVRHAWFDAWHAAFGAGRLQICAVWRGGELAALFPLRRVRGRLEALANVHSPVFTPFACDERALEAVVAEVLARREDLIVPALPTDGPAFALLIDRATRAGRFTAVTPAYDSPIAETAGVRDYGQRLSPKTRRELGRLRRKLMRETSAELTLIQRPADLESELQRGLEVEASGWKGRRGTAVLSSPATATFYRRVAQAFHAEDRLRLSSIAVDGRLVAFDLDLLDHGRLYGLKAGIDEEFKRFGPGFVLQHAALERCCELGLDAYELLGAADQYKLRFATTVRPHSTLRSYVRRPLPLARYGYYRHLRPVLRQAYHRLPAAARRR